MTTGKKVFTVRGSEDGNLGVYSNMKQAYKRANWYTSQNGGPAMTYAQVCKKLKDKGYVRIDSKNEYGSVEIEEWFLNQHIEA